MELPAHQVVHLTDSFPTGLKNAEDTAIYIGEITAARVVELADSGYMPHYRIDGGPPKFRPTEVKNWIAQNMLGRCEGRALPQAIRIVVPAPPARGDLPTAICNVENLQQLPVHGYQPGVYFLCLDDEVVYVGQSIAPSGRISTHVSDGYKKFDRVFLLPVPQSELNNVEAAFIKHLCPKEQGGIRIGRKTPVSPALTRPIGDVLADHGVTT